MDAFMNKLKKCCEIIFSTLNLDVTMFDSDFQEIPLFTRAAVPESLDRYWTDYYKIAIQYLDSNAPVCCSWHEIPSCHLLLLDVRITDPDGSPIFLCIGPALTKMYTESFYKTIPNWQELPQCEKPAIIELFRKTPFYSTRVKNAFWISYLILQQLDQLDDFYLQCPTARQEQPIPLDFFPDILEPVVTSDQINLNYEKEKNWRAFIIAGDPVGAKRSMQQMSSADYTYRTPLDPIRSQKNLYHSINALCRAAASDGGAFPVDVHNTHEYYSIQIENANNMMDIERITHDIVDSYCNIVLSAKTQNLSAPVKKAAMYLHGNYEQPITLKSLADHIHYSEGHLSRAFQKETGMTVGAYLNQLRIENARRLLDLGLYSITDVSDQVGFLSYSKFSVEFKKHTGMTATEYIRK